MIPARLAPFAIAFLLSGGMSFLVSGMATFLAIGLPSGFLGDWISAWLPAWAVAFPTLLVLRPIVTNFVMSLVRKGS
ncbi:MAG: DUF2798 domain-containing protein [Paracoccaceae bacterium]|nr:DUF2798 domain-containing protein [Paracoccaceae bacterium]